MYQRLLAEGGLVGYARVEGTERIGVFLNLSHEPVELNVPDSFVGAEIVLAAQRLPTYDRLSKKMIFDGDQGLVVKAHHDKSL